MNRVTVYAGGFFDRARHMWRVEIWHDGADAAGAPLEQQQLTLPADPLELEWSATELHESLQGSSATLRVVSNSDREFLWLYTAKDCTRGLNVYCDSRLYWTGTLDPEFYEEPYQTDRRYEVSLTFSDFAPADRLKWDAAKGTESMQTLTGVLSDFARALCIDHLALHTSNISTFIEQGGRLDNLDVLQIDRGRFFDSDGEPLTLREAVEAVFMPLGLKITQRAGRLCVYDIHAMATEATADLIDWSADRQTLSVSETYSDITLKFDPANRDTILSDECTYCHNDETGRRADLFDSYIEKGGSLTYDGFYTGTLRYSHGAGVLDAADWEAAPGVWCFDIDGGSSQAATGVARGFIDPSTGETVGTPPKSTARNAVLLLSRYIQMPAASDANTAMRLTLPVLFDARYNPTADAKDHSDSSVKNNAKAQELLQSKVKHFYIKCYLFAYNSAGRPFAAFDCTPETLNGGRDELLPMGKWKSVDPETDEAYNVPLWLHYYDTGSGSAVGGWCTNRHEYSDDYADTIPRSVVKLPEGQIIPLPPAACHLRLLVTGEIKGVRVRIPTSGLFGDALVDVISDTAPRWCMLKPPCLELVSRPRGNALFADWEDQNIEYNAGINPGGAETLSIDTLTGSMAEGVSPIARGLYRITSTGAPLQRLTRAGFTAAPEVLLLDTLCAQYTARHFVLKGETTPDARPVHPWIDRADPGSVYLLTAQTHRVAAAEADCEFRQISPDTHPADT